MYRQRCVSVVAAVLFLFFAFGAQPTDAQVTCTVGASGTYSTVNAGLLGCNGGAGSYILVLQAGETFTETLVVPDAARNVTLMSEDFSNGLVPEVPFLANITTIIRGTNHVMQNTSTSLNLLGLGIDGTSNSQPMFEPWLYNNNVTIDRCFISNWTGNYSLRIEACRRATSLTVVNTRWSNVWGSALYAVCMEDIRVTDSICDGCGGFQNYSAFYLKPSFVSEGVYIVRNVSHWLLLDTQPESCIFYGDRNRMTRCNQGSLECYNTLTTQERRPNCQQVNMSYIDEADNTTKFIFDYPYECRVYEKCKCADLEFLVNGTQTQRVAIGDLFFYTNLVLTCAALEGATPIIVLTGETNVTDPATNITTPTNNSDIYFFLGSKAGQNGVGQGPPPGNDGFSLYPNVYFEGQINQSLVNCSCAPPINQSALSLGLACDYPVIGSENVTCNNGIVGTCGYEFLLCYEASDAVVEFLQAAGNQASNLDTADMFCIANGTLTLRNDTGGAPCTAALDFSAQSPWFFTLIENNWACLVEFEANTQITVFQSGLDASAALALCSTDPDLIAQGCPALPSDPGASNFTLTCDNCTDASIVASEYLLVKVCRPYHCPAEYNVTCRYFYDGNGTVSITHLLKFTIEFADGTYWLGNNSWSNGDLVCNETDPDEDEYKNKQCLQQIFSGFACNPANSSLTETLVNLTSSSTFPHNKSSDCGSDYTCVSPTLATCSCSVADIGMCLAPYEVGRDAAGFHFDNLHSDLSFVDISFNRAQQLYLGAKLDRTPESTIYNASTFETSFSDEQARLRELWRGNYLIWGALHDLQYGLSDHDFNIAAYRFWCDGALCPL